MSLRLFAAVAVPSEARAQLWTALEGLREEHPWLRWTDPEGWHLTLAFLGWVQEDSAEAVAAALRAAAPRSAPFRLCLDGRLGSFGRGVLWAGVADPSGGLADLAEAVREELAARDLPFDDRPLRAHLTVARAPRGRRLPRGLGAGTPVPESDWLVDEALMLRSRLSREGARYETWERARLGG